MSWNYGCTDYAVPEICSPMTWYCDGWCQEACKEGWSLTWEWDQEAANNGDWENASVPVCQKCEGEGDAYFVWTGQDGRICVSGSKPDREEKPDALVTSQWGYDWCEWPAQMDWENGGCYEYSCQSGFAPQWAQAANGGQFEGGEGSGMGDYGQVCLDQERKDVECPPGMGEMSIWEEGETMNQWGYYNWEEKKYCVKTRQMKELKTPRHDLHKVFHYYDWMVKDESIEESEEIPAEASTEDFDTTSGEWVEKTAEPTFYEESNEEYLMPIKDEFEDMNSHDVESEEKFEEEHKDVDPNMFEDSGMAADMADGSLDYAGEYFDSGMDYSDSGNYETAAGTYDYSGTYDNFDSGMYDTAAGTYDYGNYETAGSGDYFDSGMYDTAAGTYDYGNYETAGSGDYFDSGLYDTAAGTYDNFESGTGDYFDSGYETAAGTADYFDSGYETAAGTADNFDSGYETTAAGTASGSGYKHKRHSRHH